jgi:hypothetical protein
LFALAETVIVLANVAFSVKDEIDAFEKITVLDNAPKLDPLITRAKLDSLPGVKAVNPAVEYVRSGFV